MQEPAKVIILTTYSTSDGIAEITVRNHLVAIFDKIGAGSRTEAVAITLRKQLLKL